MTVKNRGIKKNYRYEYQYGHSELKVHGKHQNQGYYDQYNNPEHFNGLGADKVSAQLPHQRLTFVLCLPFRVFYMPAVGQFLYVIKQSISQGFYGSLSPLARVTLPA